VTQNRGVNYCYFIGSSPFPHPAACTGLQGVIELVNSGNDLACIRTLIKKRNKGAERVILKKIAWER
jgi:hypothetical protein